MPTGKPASPFCATRMTPVVTSDRMAPAATADRKRTWKTPVFHQVIVEKVTLVSNGPGADTFTGPS